MDNFKIRATLDCSPGGTIAPRMYKIVKGASASLTYNLSKKCYLEGVTVDQLDQAIFILKYGKFVGWYEFNGDEDDPLFKLYQTEDGSGVILVLFLSSDETATFPETTPEDGMQFEVILKVKNDNIDQTLIEDQTPIWVVDSLYSQEKEKF